MQDKLKELELLVDKYISALRELKEENLNLKNKIKQLEFENKELIKEHSKIIDARKIKNIILKDLIKISEKCEKIEKELKGE